MLEVAPEPMPLQLAIGEPPVPVALEPAAPAGVGDAVAVGNSFHMEVFDVCSAPSAAHIQLSGLRPWRLGLGM